MNNTFDFYQLIHFLSVAKYGNFTKASNNIGISQPALSRSVKKLEESLGSELFDRNSRGVKLSELGHHLKKRATQIKELMEETFLEVQELNQIGEIKLGIIPTIAPYLLPSLLKACLKKHPEIKISVREDTTENLILQSKNGEIDLAIVALPINDKSLEVTILFEEELVLVLPKNHTLLEKKEVKLEDLQDKPFISLAKQHCLSDNIKDYCSRKSITPLNIESTNQLQTILELVALNHGISIIPEMARKIDKSKTREYRSFKGVKPKRVISLISNKNKFERKYFKIFKSFLDEHFDSTKSI